jgi:cathepsin B
MVQVAYEKDKTYGSKSYSVRRDVKQIQLELMNNGPVEAAFTVFEVIELTIKSGPDFINYSGSSARKGP